jgi:hypothetical protein
MNTRFLSILGSEIYYKVRNNEHILDERCYSNFELLEDITNLILYRILILQLLVKFFEY